MKQKVSISEFIVKLIDWKEFELFIAELYKDSESVVVEHNVTLLGKSNAKRQIDVFITHSKKFHTYTTLVECKKWKKPVSRQTIDILHASIEDLNASKGVIFTTKGFEKGAIEYAKSKNIDIFVVRDIRDDEFGNPGRRFTIYIQMFCSRFSNIKLPNLNYFSPQGLPPNNINLDFSLVIDKDQKYQDELNIIDMNGVVRTNLLKVLIQVRSNILKLMSENFGGIISTDDKDSELAYLQKTIINFENTDHKFIKVENGFLIIDSVEFDHEILITESKMHIDRLKNVDFALIIENYITSQKNFVSKAKDDNKIILSDPVKNLNNNESEGTLKDNSILKIITEPYVSFSFKTETPIKKIDDITVDLNIESYK